MPRGRLETAASVEGVGSGPVDDADLEGSLVLEALAAEGLVEDFYAAVDSEDLQRVRALMRRAGVDAATMDAVVALITGEES